MNSKFWKNKKILITGHTGFKGGWLSIWLQRMGANVTGISLSPPSIPNLYDKANVAEGMLSLREDIRNLNAIKKNFARIQPEIIFHLAAQPLVRYAYRNPVETYQTNVMGTLNILESIRSIDSISAAVIVTTDKCYENREWDWGYREEEPMGGYDPYSSSKACVELLIASYRRSYFASETDDHYKTAIASVRAGNVIGGGDWAEDRLIPDVIRAMQKKEFVQIRNPKSVRPWQHVLEPLAGYIDLAEQLYEKGSAYAGAWNFGPKDEDARPVQWIVEKMTQLWGGDMAWKIDGGENPHEAKFLKLDCSKAHNHLFWWPKWDLIEALRKIVDWHKSELAEHNLRDICINQINEYMNTKNPY